MDMIFETIGKMFREQKDDSSLRRIMKNLLCGGVELVVSVILLCFMGPVWERHGFFPSRSGGAANILIFFLMVVAIIHIIQCMVRALQLFNEYRYEKKYGAQDPSEE